MFGLVPRLVAFIQGYGGPTVLPPSIFAFRHFAPFSSFGMEVRVLHELVA